MNEENTNALAVAEPPKSLAPKPQVLAGERGLKFSDMESMWRFCVAVANSQEFKDVATPEAAMMRIQAGAELGLSPVWSLANIFFHQGKPTVWGDALIGIVLSQPMCEDVIETATGKFPDEDYTAICEVRRKGRAPVIREFSVADAKKAGLFGKNVHGSYPKRMLQMRARSWACRDAFADKLRGLGVNEELKDIPEPQEPRAKVTLVLPEGDQ